MILIDFSSIFARSVYSASKVGVHKENGFLKTEEFISEALYRIVDELIFLQKTYSQEYGDLIICKDAKSGKYWRHDIYPLYKSSRKVRRDNTEINYAECKKYFNVLGMVLDKFVPWKVIEVENAEADDVIGFLTNKFCNSEKILIWSPDKDFKQLHKLSPSIKQWSPLTNGWVVNDKPYWFERHTCLGDAGDDVPRIVDFLDFTDEFREFIKIDENEFYDLSWNEKIEYVKQFLNLDQITSIDFFKIYNKKRFGEKTLIKILESEGLESYLKTNPILEKQFKLNCSLVLDTKVPQDLEIKILSAYLEAKNEFNFEKVNEYFDKLGLDKIQYELKGLFLKSLNETPETSQVDFSSFNCI